MTIDVNQTIATVKEKAAHQNSISEIYSTQHIEQITITNKTEAQLFVFSGIFDSTSTDTDTIPSSTISTTLDSTNSESSSHFSTITTYLSTDKVKFVVGRYNHTNEHKQSDKHYQLEYLLFLILPFFITTVVFL